MKNLTKATAFQLLSLIILLASSSAVFAQTAERSIILPEVRGSSNDKGLEFVEMSVDGKPIVPGTPFVAGDDWLSSLTFKIKNITGKPLRYIQMGFGMPETKPSGKLLGFNFSYGTACNAKDNADCAAKSKDLKLVMPDEIIEMKFDAKNYQRNQAFIQRVAGLTVVNHIQVGLTSYQFEDGTGGWTQDYVIPTAPEAKENK